MNHSEVIKNATQILIDHVDELTLLDKAIGDGDHGLNMKRGATAIQLKLSELEAMSLNEALMSMGKICVATIGGSSGPVFGTLLVSLGKNLPSNPDLSSVANSLRIGINDLIRLGKAQVGQKTLLDVLDPVQKLIASECPNEAVLSKIKKCAFDSCAATADIEATRGRASFLGERAMGHVDPGSRSMALIIGAICETLE